MAQEKVFKPRINLENIQKLLNKVQDEIRKVIIGQDSMIQLLSAAMLTGGHILIEGVPGIAKTLTAKLFARTLGINFSRIQFTPDLMPSDVLGTSVYNAKKSEFEFRRGPIFAGVLLVDEVNRAPAKTQSALIEVMEERQVTVDGTTYPMEKPFIVVATQNPIEHEGTYRLPEAQLDRFLFKIQVEYPSLEQEIGIITRFQSSAYLNEVESVKPVLNADRLLEFSKAVFAVHIEENLIRYIARIIHETRSHSGLILGGSPRASLSVAYGAKAIAIINGRDFVTPDDVQFVVFPALRHRLILTPEKEIEGALTDDIIKDIILKLEVPR
ncbi:MAG: MoxR family ATPase [Spirochaetes bacterium]|nr:MoxR family ATPase [Spirochaetota bacterium]